MLSNKSSNNLINKINDSKIKTITSDNRDSSDNSNTKLVKKISGIILCSGNGMEINIPRIKIIDSNLLNSEKIVSENNNYKTEFNENENNIDTIEKHKLLVKLSNIDKEVEVDEGDLEQVDEIKLKNEDIDSLTK